MIFYYRKIFEEKKKRKHDITGTIFIASSIEADELADGCHVTCLTRLSRFSSLSLLISIEIPSSISESVLSYPFVINIETIIKFVEHNFLISNTNMLQSLPERKYKMKFRCEKYFFNLWSNFL